MAKQSKITLKQVADLAEVSVASASMILSQKEGVSFSAETISRVRLAAESLGYSKGTAAGRAEQREPMIAIFLPSVSGNFYATMAQAISAAADEQGINTFCFETYNSQERELRSLTHVSGSDVAGIVFTYVPHHYALVEEIARTIPVVVIGDRNDSIRVRVDMVETDSYRTGEIVAEHLLALGHRHIAFLATRHEWSGYSSSQRILGVRDAIKRAGTAVRLVEKSHIIRDRTLGEDSKETRRRIGRELTRECLADRDITAFIAVNDYLAYGVLDALHAEGFRVPEDYSVCGNDDLFSSSLPGVGLTTVNHHLVQKGHNAFSLLYSNMQERRAGGSTGKGPTRYTRVEYLSTLVVRTSTAPPARRG